MYVFIICIYGYVCKYSWAPDRDPGRGGPGPGPGLVGPGPISIFHWTRSVHYAESDPTPKSG